MSQACIVIVARAVLGSPEQTWGPLEQFQTTHSSLSLVQVKVLGTVHLTEDSVSGSERPGHSHQDCTEQEEGTTQGMRTHSPKDGGYRASERLQKSLATCCERAGTIPYLSLALKPGTKSALIKVCSLEQNKLMFSTMSPPNPLVNLCVTLQSSSHAPSPSPARSPTQPTQPKATG